MRLKTFVTLSPVPAFARWLARAMETDAEGLLSAADVKVLQQLRNPAWREGRDRGAALNAVLMPLAAHYFLRAKSDDGQPVDPVARFHLGNGARLERLNWLGDISEKGLRESHGLMVNYLYDLDQIEANHEAYENEGMIATAKSVRSLLRPAAKATTAKLTAPKQLAPPAKG